MSFQYQNKKRKIYDVILFNGELNVLGFRLNQLNSFVDYFIIVESEKISYEVNKELLDIYAKCSTGAEVVQKQNEFLLNEKQARLKAVNKSDFPPSESENSDDDYEEEEEETCVSSKSPSHSKSLSKDPNNNVEQLEEINEDLNKTKI